MHYYNFNIKDYAVKTAHLEPIEDLIYRRLIDLYYLTEKPLIGDVEQLAKLIRMRAHENEITSILKEFFFLKYKKYHLERAEIEIFTYKEKSNKAKNSAKARWRKSTQPAETQGPQPDGHDDANAMRTHSDGNAIGMLPVTKNKEPLTINKEDQDLQSQQKVVTKVKPKKFEENDLLIAKEMYQEILKKLPTAKKPNFETWATEISKMQRLDNRTPDQMYKVFMWSRADQFWQGNILSPKKLRDKFDVLSSQMIAGNQQSGYYDKTASLDFTQEQSDQFVQDLIDTKNGDKL